MEKSGICVTQVGMYTLHSCITTQKISIHHLIQGITRCFASDTNVQLSRKDGKHQKGEQKIGWFLLHLHQLDVEDPGILPFHIFEHEVNNWDP